jgi:hypothetical protein
MNRRDQELLDKQLGHLAVAPRSDGVLLLAVLAVFFVGMTLGGFLYAYTDEPPLRVATNDATPALPQGLPHVRWQ